ncbi:zinc-binding dehydrogenase [Nigerium massiliense]|uniref:zinc-binding dehydrogenase n=1 Tax=Nigerium massiliense TaxID=1522317 RepID=UPI000693BF06|nr:zinc-binding dehydrogenase [Nigerium massiliense]
MPSDGNWVAAVRERFPDGVDVVIDAVGGDALRAAATLIKDPSRLRSADDLALASTLGGSGVARRRDSRVYAQLAQFVADGVVTPVVDQVHPFPDAAAASRTVASGHAAGKTVITR